MSGDTPQLPALIDPYAVVPSMYSNFQEKLELIKASSVPLAQSGLCKNPAEAFAMMLYCVTTGTDIIQFKREYDIIEGNVTMKAAAMLAHFLQLGGKHRILSRTSELASVQMAFRGNEMQFSLSFDEAKDEPFVYAGDGGFKKNWKTPRARKQMLWARVISDGVRTLAPEVNTGVYTPEEVADFDDNDYVPPPEVIVTDVPTGTPQPEPVIDAFHLTPEDLTEMGTLVHQLEIDPVDWKTKVLGHYGVASAEEFTRDQYDEVMGVLRSKDNPAALLQELDDWAKLVLPDQPEPIPTETVSTT